MPEENTAAEPIDSTSVLRRRVLEASDEDLSFLAKNIKDALEADSNDAEHDALIGVAELLGIDYEVPEW